MGWTATPVEWEIRWGDEHHSYERSDPYTGVARVVRVGHEAYVSLTCGTGLRVSEVREMHEFCKANGMWPVRWVHHGLPHQAKDRG